MENVSNLGRKHAKVLAQWTETLSLAGYVTDSFSSFHLQHRHSPCNFPACECFQIQ